MGCPTTVRPLDELLQQAIALKVDGNYDEAERAIKEVLSSDPDHPVAHRELGLVYCFTGYWTFLTYLKAQYTLRKYCGRWGRWDWCSRGRYLTS